MTATEMHKAIGDLIADIEAHGHNMSGNFRLAGANLSSAELYLEREIAVEEAAAKRSAEAAVVVPPPPIGNN